MLVSTYMKQWLSPSQINKIIIKYYLNFRIWTKSDEPESRDPAAIYISGATLNLHYQCCRSLLRSVDNDFWACASGLIFSTYLDPDGDIFIIRVHLLSRKKQE